MMTHCNAHRIGLKGTQRFGLAVLAMAAFLACLATAVFAATSEQVGAAQVEIARAQAVFVPNAARVTGLSEAAVREFMPGGPYYGKNIGDIYPLTADQAVALRQVDNAKRARIQEIRQLYDIDPAAMGF